MLIKIMYLDVMFGLTVNSKNCTAHWRERNCRGWRVGLPAKMANRDKEEAEVCALTRELETLPGKVSMFNWQAWRHGDRESERHKDGWCGVEVLGGGSLE